MRADRSTQVLKNAFAIALLALVSGTGWSQLAPVGGSVSGKVVDREGNRVTEATVQIVGERRFKAQSDRWGYRFDHLPSDTYSVEASAPGYITSLVERVDVRLGDSLRIDFRLRKGKPNAVSFTTMPIIDTRTPGAAYRLFDPPIGSLPLAGTLSAIERLLPLEPEVVSTPSLYIDGAEVLPEVAIDYSIWRPALGRLASELFETADLFGSQIDPRVRTLDSLQLLTRGSSSLWHGRFGVRYNSDALAGDDQVGLAEKYDETRPHAALLVPIGSKFRLFSALAKHQRTARPVDLSGTFEEGALLGLRAEREDASRFFRLNGGPLGPNLELSASLLQIDSRDETYDPALDGPFSGDAQSASRATLETDVRRAMVRLNRFSGRFGTIVQLSERRGDSAIDLADARRVETRAQSLSLDTLIARHAMVLGVSHEETTGDLLPASFDRLLPQPNDRLLELERVNVSLSDQWRATQNLAVQIGVRGERLNWTEIVGARPKERHEMWWLPRIGFAWDVLGNGEWALLVSGGEELVRQAAIFDLGLEPYLDRGLPPTDRVEVEAFSLSSRYQVFPGLIIDSEVGRRRFSGDREVSIRPVAEKEQRLRFGAEARIGSRWLARGQYELRDIGVVEPGILQDAPATEFGTTQRTHFHVVRTFEKGWVLSGIYEYIDNYGVTARSLGVVSEVPAEIARTPATYSQLDLMLEYRLGGLPRLPFLGDNQPKLTWRVEVLNVTDHRTPPAQIPAVLVGPGVDGLFPQVTLGSEAISGLRPDALGSAGKGGLVPATQQLGRRVWIGFGLEL